MIQVTISLIKTHERLDDWMPDAILVFVSIPILWHCKIFISAFSFYFFLLLCVVFCSCFQVTFALNLLFSFSFIHIVFIPTTTDHVSLFNSLSLIFLSCIDMNILWWLRGFDTLLLNMKLGVCFAAVTSTF